MPWSPAPSSSPPLFLLGVDAHGDVGRLAVQQHLDVGAVIGKAVLVVADVLDHVARDLRDQFAVDHRLVAVLAEERRLAAAFAGDHDLVGGRERFAAEPRVHLAVVGDAELDVVLEERIEHRVGNLVADLVGVTFGNRLAGEQEIGVSHAETPPMARCRVPRRFMAGVFLAVAAGEVKMRAAVGNRRGHVRRELNPLRRRSARPDRRCGGAACCS